MSDLAYNFWERVDQVRGNKPLAEIAESIGIKNQSLRAMRSQNRYPKSKQIQLLANVLNTTVEFLITGNKESNNGLCEEAQYVQDNLEARVLVRAIMDDPALLSPLSTIVSSRIVNNKKDLQA